MTVVQSLRFAFWFACIDLCGRWRSLHLTLVNVATVLVLVAFTTLMYGLVLGTDQRRMKQLEKEPQAACLRVHRPGRRILPDEIAPLAQKVQQGLPVPDHLRACSPYRLIEQDWYYSDEDASPKFRGRTLGPKDLLFEGLRGSEHWLAGGPPAPDTEGVVVSADMLEELRGDPKHPPGKLFVRVGVGKEAVPVLGVLAEKLPGGKDDYVLRESDWERLQAKNSNPQATEIFSGPLPAAWPAEPPVAVGQYLKDQGVEWVSRTPRGDGKVWRFQWAAGQEAVPRLTQWQVYLENVARRMGGNAPAFMTPEPVAVVDPAPTKPEGYDRVSLYLRDLEELNAADAAARSLGYESEGDVLSRMAGIQAATAVAQGLVDVVVLAVALLAAWNLFVIQDLRAQQKVREIGMLKAMGLSGPVLILVQLVEAGLIWVVGLSLGLLAGWGCGAAAEGWIARQLPESVLAFSIPWPHLAVIVVASSLLCLASTLLATSRARRVAPLVSLAAA